MAAKEPTLRRPREIKKRHSAAFKARVAPEAAKQTRTLTELSGTFQVHSVPISKWKKQLLDGIESMFGDGHLWLPSAIAVAADPQGDR